MVIFKSNLTYFITLGLESSEILNDQELESLYGMLAFDSANLIYIEQLEMVRIILFIYNLICEFI